MSEQTNREVFESPIDQGKDEKIAYWFLTTPWGTNPSNVVVTIYDQAKTDVSATCLSGGVVIAGDKITFPPVINLTPGIIYRLEVKFEVNGNTFEPYCYIKADY